MHQQLAENSPKLRGTAMPLESLVSRLGEILDLPSDNLKTEGSPWLCCLNEVRSEGARHRVEPGKDTYSILTRPG